MVDRIRLFLASPGDVSDERTAVREIAESLNRVRSNSNKPWIEVVGWETHTFPAYGGDPQSIVNKQIADMGKFDLFVGIMWNRFGKPTPRAKSGTLAEFELAKRSYECLGRPHIMFYFRQQPALFDTVEDCEQY